MNPTTDQKRFEPETGVLPTLAPLNVGIEDKKLLKYVKELEKQAKNHWDSPEINLTKRREQMVRYLFGKQLIGKQLKKYESELIDNVIYETEKFKKALATSKMPDIVVEAGGLSNNDTRKLTAEMLTKVFEKIIDSDENKADLGMMYKHLPAYLIAAKKYRWDASKDKLGNYVEEVINPSTLLLDHTALSSNPDEMLFIIHYVEKTAKEWVMLFPKKEEEIKKEVTHKLKAAYSEGEDLSDWLLAQKVKVGEVWFDWFDKAQDFDAEENPNFDYTSGVAWKLSDDVMLGSSKNPNWDYEGHDVATINGDPISPDIMEQYILSGQQPDGFEVKKVFNNYFKYPKKPFIFMTFEQFLRSPIDETSRIEQIIPMQKSMDDVERQTDYMVKNHKGKHIWGQDSGVTKKSLREMDMNNPDNDAVIKGDPNKTHAFIQPVMPPAEMFVHIRDRRDRMFAKVNVHGATRGELTTQVATSNQISREGDFTANDDEVNSTILPVSTKSIEARMHIMKLRYTPQHWQQIAGIEEGKYLALRINNDSIDDGMEVKVKTSTVDKLRAERNAQNMASAKLIDPYYFYKDMGIPDAEGRAEALFLFNTSPELWYKKIVLGQDISQIANQVVGQTQAAIPGAQEATAQSQTAPTTPSPADTTNIATTPQGGQGMISRAIGGIKNFLGGGA